MWRISSANSPASTSSSGGAAAAVSVMSKSIVSDGSAGRRGVGRLAPQRGVAALQFAQRGQDLVNLGEKPLARGAAEVERAGRDEVFQHAFVDGPDVDAQQEFGEIPERPAGLALADDLLRGGFAHALDAGETESDLAG